MKYAITVNRRIRYVKVYSIIKRIGERQNALSKFLTKIFNPKQPDRGAM